MKTLDRQVTILSNLFRKERRTCNIIEYYNEVEAVWTIPVMLCFVTRKPVSRNVIGQNMGPSGGWVLPYISYIGICRPKGLLFSHFGLKTGIDFDHYGLKLGMVFKGTSRDRINVFVVSTPDG